MTGKRVLHVLAALDFGGVESQMKIIAENSHLSEWEHLFCALGRGGAVQEDLLAIGARADALSLHVKIPSPKAILGLRRHIRQLRPDALHLHGSEANFHGIIAGKLAGTPVIIAEEIGIPRHSLKARQVFSWAYRRCSRVVAISQAVKDAIVLLNEATADQIEVIYNPFEPQEFRSIAQCGDQIKLGFVGRLEPVKNPAAAILAVAKLRQKGKNVSLKIVGEGSQRSKLEEIVADLQLHDCVEVMGFKPRPFEVLKDCHFYLQPSLTEGFGLAICEAMSAGIPVIASAVGGAPEIITHGETGWLLPRPDATALAEAVEAGASLSHETLSEMSAQARKVVLERFGVATYLRRLDELYMSCC